MLKQSVLERCLLCLAAAMAVVGGEGSHCCGAAPGEQPCKADGLRWPHLGQLVPALSAWQGTTVLGLALQQVSKRWGEDCTSTEQCWKEAWSWLSTGMGEAAVIKRWYRMGYYKKWWLLQSNCLLFTSFLVVVSLGFLVTADEACKLCQVLMRRKQMKSFPVEQIINSHSLQGCFFVLTWLVQCEKFQGKKMLWLDKMFQFLCNFFLIWVAGIAKPK